MAEDAVGKAPHHIEVNGTPYCHAGCVGGCLARSQCQLDRAGAEEVGNALRKFIGISFAVTVRPGVCPGPYAVAVEEGRVTIHAIDATHS